MITNPCHMSEITFEKLPMIVSQLRDEIVNLKKFLIEKKWDQDQDSVHWLNLTELCEYLPDKPSKATVYSWIHNRSIPHHKGPKKLRFLRAEIDTWLKEGKKNIISGPEIPPESYLKIKNKMK